MELKPAFSKDYNAKSNTKISVESRKVFIGGLPKDLELKEFKEYFDKFGEIENRNREKVTLILK